MLLMREPDGRWVLAPPPPEKLVPISRPVKEESAPEEAEPASDQLALEPATAR